MSEKKGSSSYGHGDAGGSYGDYAHGVSQRWVMDSVRGAFSKKSRRPSGERVAKFMGRMSAGYNRNKKRKGKGVGHKYLVAQESLPRHKK